MDLILDDREESALYKLLSGYDFPVAQARLEFGDACWEGRGPSGPVLVGVERKKLADLIGSMQDRRLCGHQLNGMWRHYDYCYLLVEDVWRPAEHGSIEIARNGSWQPLYSSHGNGETYRQLQNYLNTLEVLGGVIVVRSGGVRETAAIYAALVKWWGKEWEEHHSHDAVYTPGPTQLHRGRVRMSLRTPGIVEKIAAQLPGIDRKCWEVGKRFQSVEQMVNASLKDWLEVPGIGKRTAAEVMRALHTAATGATGR